MSEIVHNGSSFGAWTLPPDPHQEFQELCALSTTGELTAEEWRRLTEHLAHCEVCTEAKQQYEHVVATAIPVLASEAAAERGDENASGSWSIEEAEDALMESLRRELTPSGGDLVRPITSSRWKHVRRFAMAATILVACSIGGYWIGSHQKSKPDAVAARLASESPSTPSRLQPSVAATVPAFAKTAAPEDEQTSKLRDQVRTSQLEVAKLDDQLSQLEEELARRSTDLDRSVQDRADLDRQLALAQANVQSHQAKLNLNSDQTSQETAQSIAFNSKVDDLKTALEEKDKEIAQERELLQHDRDIRNLIGARNLYIAEIYDVAKTGDTQKPFGRVFYTKDKSLIFYGYDLDQQRGVKKDTAYQAWGRRGTDRHHDVSLGLLFQDDANQKRWVLKFNDAKTIAQIDAVFVTVEPEGGSAKPSGKPLLFTYLRIDPNHP